MKESNQAFIFVMETSTIKHFVEPSDTTSLVKIGNAILRGVDEARS